MSRIWSRISRPHSWQRFLQSDKSPSLPNPKESRSLLSREIGWAFRESLQLLLRPQSWLGRTFRFCSCFWDWRWFRQKLEHCLLRVQCFLLEVQQLAFSSCSILESLRFAMYCKEVRVVLILPCYASWNINCLALFLGDQWWHYLES